MREFERSRRQRWIALGFAVCSLVSATALAQPTVGALRLVVEPERSWGVVGTPLQVDIGLRDARNRPAAAPTTLIITLAVIPPFEGAPSRVIIPAGQPSATLQLRPSTSGILEIRATHRQAFAGSTFVRVLRTPPPVRRPRSGSISQRSFPRILADPLGQPPVATPPPANPVPAPHLALRYSPQRKLLADGQDAATIQAFVLDDDAGPAAEDSGGLKVTLFASSGKLAPVPLVIQGFEGRTTLTSDRIGDINIEFMSSEPSAEIEGDRRLHIRFGPPIVGLRLEAKPETIWLMEDADLIVTLVDAEGRAVATDEPRPISLALDTGHGQIVSKELIVQSGDSAVRTRFVPSAGGPVRISATSTSLVTQTVQLDVHFPLRLLAIWVIAGALGGLLPYARSKGKVSQEPAIARGPDMRQATGRVHAFLRRHRKVVRRVALGPVAGSLLYWLVVRTGIPLIPYPVLADSFAAFFISLVGGFVGYPVFSLGFSLARGLFAKAHESSKKRGGMLARLIELMRPQSVERLGREGRSKDRTGDKHVAGPRDKRDSKAGGQHPPNSGHAHSAIDA